jgi:hypothetical protein
MGSVNNSNSDSEMTNSDVNNASSSSSSSSSNNSVINRNNKNDINIGELCEGFFDTKYMNFSGGIVDNITKMMVIGNSMEIIIAPNKNILLRKDSNDTCSFFSLQCMINSNNNNIHSSSGNRKCCDKCKSEKRKSFWNRNIRKINNNDNKSILDMTSKDVKIMSRNKLNENFITLGNDQAYQIFLTELKTHNDVNDDNDTESDNSDDSFFIPDNESDDNIDMNNDKTNDMICHENNKNEKSIMMETVDDKDQISAVNRRYIDLLMYIHISIFVYLYHAYHSVIL